MVCWCLRVCLYVRAEYTWTTLPKLQSTFVLVLHSISWWGTRGGGAQDAHIPPCSASNSAVDPRAHMSWGDSLQAASNRTTSVI